MGNLGSDCPVSGIVSESLACRAAGVQLGKTYYAGVVNSRERPAGCYYWSDDNYVYLNSFGPSDTQNIISTAGGVCKGGISDLFCTYCTYTK